MRNAHYSFFQQVSALAKTLPTPNRSSRSVQWWIGHDWLYWAALQWELECNLTEGYCYEWNNNKKILVSFTAHINKSYLLLTIQSRLVFQTSFLLNYVCRLFFCRPAGHMHVHLAVCMTVCMRVWLCVREVKSSAFCLSPAKCLNPG